MAARPAALARRATSAGGNSPADAVEWQWRSTRTVSTLRRGPGRLRRAEQVQELPVGQLGERRVRAAAPDRGVAREAALALGPGPVLEHEPELVFAVHGHPPRRIDEFGLVFQHGTGPELVFAVHGHPPRRIDLPRLAVHDDAASRHGRCYASAGAASDTSVHSSQASGA